MGRALQEKKVLQINAVSQWKEAFFHPFHVTRFPDVVVSLPPWSCLESSLNFHDHLSCFDWLAPMGTLLSDNSIFNIIGTRSFFHHLFIDIYEKKNMKRHLFFSYFFWCLDIYWESCANHLFHSLTHAYTVERPQLSWISKSTVLPISYS